MGGADMVTSVTSFSRTGLSDWLIQRVTSLVLLAYFIVIAYQLVGSVDYTSWRLLFDQTWMKVFTLHGCAVSCGTQLDRFVVCFYRLPDREDVGAEGKCHQAAQSAGGVSGVWWLCDLGGGHYLELSAWTRETWVDTSERTPGISECYENDFF